MLSQIGQALTSMVKLGLYQIKVIALSQLCWACVRNCLINEAHLAMNLFNSILTQNQKNG